MTGNLRSSSYNLRFELPFLDRVLLMHGYTGALDIVSPQLANLLCSGNGAHEQVPLDHDVRETLHDRGYLTAHTKSEEQERVDKIFEVFERRLQPSVTLGLKLRGSAADLEAGVLSDTRKLFAGLNSLRQYHVGGALALDLTGVTGALDFYLNLSERAKEWSYALVVTIRGRMAESLMPFLHRDKIQYLRVLSVDPDFGQEASAVTDFLQQVLEKGLKCDWLISVDGRSEDEVREVYESARRVKQMRKGHSGVVNVLFVSEREGGAPKVLLEAPEPVQAISTGEIPLYHHLCRFIEAPGLVNLRPYFSIPDTNFVVDSSCEISLVSRDGRSGTSTVPVGRLVDGSVELNNGQPADLAAYPNAPGTRRSAGSDGCPYALICGVHCGIEQADGISACSSIFRHRVERVAPLILFNKLQIV